MSKSPWGNIGAWAAEAERADEEEREAAAASAVKSSGDSQKYPSLKDSVTAAGKQKKKTKMSLQEFTTMGSAPSRHTPEQNLHLPKGPKERSGDEDQFGRLGGGFSSYGGGQGRMRTEYDSEGQGGGRRGYGGFDDDRRRGPISSRDSEFDQMPSRADEADNWGSMKRSQPTFDSNNSARPTRYSALGGGGGGGGAVGGGFSRADEVDNWGSGKKPLPPPQSRPSFGSGFRDSRPGPETDRWTRDNTNNNQEPLKFVLDQSTVKQNKSNPFGDARPREEVLTEKGLDWKKLDLEKEISRPGSSHSRPGSSQSGRTEGLPLQDTIEAPIVKPKPRVNPFGDAKPREVLLQEKGLDWKKIDLELDHKRIDRPETEEEKNLKEEIENLKKDSLEKPSEEQENLQGLILQKEKDLETLIRQFDDKVRFGQKTANNNERPGSGSGRYTGPALRSPSGPGGPGGPYEEVMDNRPRSREGWARPRGNEPIRSFSGNRERGYSGNRDFNSPRSNRW